MSIAVLTIGDELLNGDQPDTNTAAIARLLGAEDLAVQEGACVGDDEAAIAATLNRLAAGHRVVIVTGGLGPTADDRTARGAAKALGSHLSLDPLALRQVRSWFQARGLEMHPREEKLALLPARAAVITNPRGVAPGFRLHHPRGAELFFLPGVPAEMRAMLAAEVLPALLGLFPDRPPRAARRLTLFGLAEAEVESRLQQAALPHGVALAYTVDFPLVRVRLSATGDEAAALVDRAELAARRTFGEHLAGVGDDGLAESTARQLSAAGLTVALAESCTGGLIAKLLTDLAGSSAFFLGSAVTYANEAKTAWLGIPAELLASVGAVSAECAAAMARGVRQRAGSDLGLAVTGIAGPAGGSDAKPVGTVFIALADAGGSRVEGLHFTGDRDQIRLYTACTAIDWLRRYALAALARDAARHPVP